MSKSDVEQEIEKGTCVLCGKKDDEANLADLEVLGIRVLKMHVQCASDAEKWTRLTKKLIIDRIL